MSLQPRITKKEGERKRVGGEGGRKRGKERKKGKKKGRGNKPS